MNARIDGIFPEKGTKIVYTETVGLLGVVVCKESGHEFVK